MLETVGSFFASIVCIRNSVAKMTFAINYSESVGRIVYIWPLTDSSISAGLLRVMIIGH